MNGCDEDSRSDGSPRPFVEGVDYYIEDGLLVLTEHFLKKRRYCCGSGCRNCPYSTEERETALKKKVV
jgi:hypothetical protein